MAIEMHLRKPPIMEALVDFRVQLHDDLTPALLDKLRDELRTHFPVVQPIRLIQGQFTSEGGGFSTTTTDKGLAGYRFSPEDRGCVVQVRVDGFTYNKLPLYSNWNEVFEEAWKYWESYQEIAQPEVIPRVAVRYINKITISADASLSEYLVDPPTFSWAPPESKITGHLKRVIIQEPSGLAAGVVRAIELSADQTTLEVLLDIDVFSAHDFDPIEDRDRLRSTFQKLRRLKNHIFFKSLTEKALEAYK